MNALLTALYTFCETQGLARTYWVGFSGGLDSSVLLSLCHVLAKQHAMSFRVVHVNHQLQPQATEWAAFAREQAAYYQFPYTEQTLTHQRLAGESIEAYAREARYALFAELLQANDVLLTAHHQDDQAETVLLQLMRGAGVNGLAAMPLVKPFAAGVHGRPLLSFSREALHAFAVEQALTWMDDLSNDDTALSRNYIRHRVMPLLKARWPSAPQLLARSAANCARVLEIAEAQMAARDVAGVALHTLSASKLMQLSQSERYASIRAWVMQAGYYPPTQKMLKSIEETVLASRWDKMPSVSLGRGVCVRRYRDDVHLDVTPIEGVSRLNEMIWGMTQDCVIPGVGRLEAVRVLGGGHIPADVESLNVRFLPPSERITVRGRGRSHSMSTLFQEWGVPPWLRCRTPLLFLRDELVGVPGYYWVTKWQDHSSVTSARLKINFYMNK